MRRRCDRALLPALLLMLLVGIAGCFEVHEDVWVHPDGTVRYRVDYAVPESMLSLLGVDGANPDSVLAHARRPPAAVIEGDSVWNRDYPEGGLHHFVSERQVKSIERFVILAAHQEAHADSLARHAAIRDSLIQAMERDTSSVSRARLESIMTDPEWNEQDPMMSLAGQVAGHYESMRVAGGGLRLRHSFKADARRASAGPGVTDGSRDAEYGRRMLAGRTFSYRLHAPRVVSTNGMLKEDDVVEWSFPMANLVGDSERTMDAVIELRGSK